MTLEEQKLLQEGINEYVDALNAINVFRSLIQAECRKVIEGGLKEYGAALGVDSSKLEILEIKERETSDGKTFYLGVRCIPKGYVELGHCFYWERADGTAFETGICMWVWSKRRNIERLRDALREKSLDYQGQDGESIWLSQEVTAADVNRIANKLDDLMKKWIKLWQKVGGIKALGELSG